MTNEYRPKGITELSTWVTVAIAFYQAKQSGVLTPEMIGAMVDHSLVIASASVVYLRHLSKKFGVFAKLKKLFNRA